MTKTQTVMNTLAVASSKGGVTKTTTVVSVAAALAELGRRTLVVDLDPQGHSTHCSGLEAPAGQQGVHQVVARGQPIKDWARASDFGFDVLTGGDDTMQTMFHLQANRTDELRLREALAETDYDVILLDCPGAIGELTLAGLQAARRVLVPVTLTDLALKGLVGMHGLISKLVERGIHPTLELAGVLETAVDMRNNNSRVIHAELVENAGALLLRGTVRASSYFPASSKARTPITHYMPQAPCTLDIRAVTAELLERGIV